MRVPARRPLRSRGRHPYMGSDDKMSIMDPLKYENLSSMGSGAKFPCQSPAGAALVPKIPLPASSTRSRQEVDHICFFACDRIFCGSIRILSLRAGTMAEAALTAARLLHALGNW